jgi:hypothetical protein
MAQQQQQRPTGITILAILAFIGGVFGLCGGAGGFLGGSLLGGLGASAGVGDVTGLGGMLAIYSLIVTVLAVAELVFGFGAWTLKPWAWTLGLVLFGINVAFQVVALLIGWTSFGGIIIPVAIAAVIIYYLMTPDVKKAFGRA